MSGTPDTIARTSGTVTTGRIRLTDPRARYRRFAFVVIVASGVIETLALLMAVLGFSWDWTVPLSVSALWTLIAGKWVADIGV